MKQALPRTARLYLVAVAGLALGLGFLVWPAIPQPAWTVGLLLVAALGAIAHAFPIPGRNHEAYHATLPFVIMAAALFTTPELAMFVVLIHLAEQLRTRRVWYIQLFNVCCYFISASLAGITYRLALATLTLGGIGQIEAALSAGCCFILVNRLLVAGVLWLARGLSPARSGLFRPELLATDLIIIWVAAPMLMLALLTGFWTLALTAGPLFLARPALSYLLSGPVGYLRPAEARSHTING